MEAPQLSPGTGPLHVLALFTLPGSLAGGLISREGLTSLSNPTPVHLLHGAYHNFFLKKCIHLLAFC